MEICYTRKKKIKIVFSKIAVKISKDSAIISSMVGDKFGIAAGVSTKIAELGLNIDDISQTVLDDFYHDGGRFLVTKNRFHLFAK